ncbi:hypothetical protein B0H21DRAFT_705950 [Amylocystis lapponica]|nr:hypothetical protein B0H21DRAFT_705950 [Amylocystis lapponica]
MSSSPHGLADKLPHHSPVAIPLIECTLKAVQAKLRRCAAVQIFGDGANVVWQSEASFKPMEFPDPKTHFTRCPSNILPGSVGLAEVLFETKKTGMAERCTAIGNSKYVYSQFSMVVYSCAFLFLRSSHPPFQYNIEIFSRLSTVIKHSKKFDGPDRRLHPSSADRGRGIASLKWVYHHHFSWYTHLCRHRTCDASVRLFIDERMYLLNDPTDAAVQFVGSGTMLPHVALPCGTGLSLPRVLWAKLLRSHDLKKDPTSYVFSEHQ